MEEEQEEEDENDCRQKKIWQRKWQRKMGTNVIQIDEFQMDGNGWKGETLHGEKQKPENKLS